MTEEAKPLAWLEEMRTRSWLTSFLADVPVLGLQSRVRRDIVRQLKARDIFTQQAWGQDALTVAIASRAAAIIADCLNWPRAYYLPDDPCEILFYDPSMDLRAETAVDAIKREFGLAERYVADIAEITLGQLVARIASYLIRRRDDTQ